MSIPIHYIMKNLKYLLTSLTLVCLFIACSSDDSSPEKDPDKNPVEHLNKVVESQSTNGYHLELFSVKKTIQTGSNALVAKISKNEQSTTASDLQLSITMHMNSNGHTMSHGAPVVQLKPTTDKGYYEGYIFPTMASHGDTDYWVLKLTTTIDNQTVTFEEKIEVNNSKDKTLVSFKNQDTQYTLALIEPSTPKIGLNESSALLFATPDNTVFEIVDAYTIHIDPRMPSMGNHSSPNNIDFTQAKPQELYKGQLSLTMSGYWKINLMVRDALGNLIKGNPITEEQESSDIFFELEF